MKCLLGPVLALQLASHMLMAQADCDKMVFVESPLHDAYISVQSDSATYGELPNLQLRGTPEKKSLVPILGYEVQHVDPSYVTHCYLKVYTVSKKKECEISVFGTTNTFDEVTVSSKSYQLSGTKLVSKKLQDQPYIEFDVTDYVKEYLKTGHINFYLKTDSKKTIEIASRESGLSPELIIEICSLAAERIQVSQHKGVEKASMEILPNLQPGKMTVQLTGVPPGGFADLMIMNAHGQIIRKVPLAIREGKVLYHAIEYGDLIPGEYVALFRKGRVMIKRQFTMRPSREASRMLEVQWVADQAKKQ